MRVGWKKPQESNLLWRKYLLNVIKKDKSWVDNIAEKAYDDFRKRKTELLEVSLSQNEDGEELSCEIQNMPKDLTIWKEVVPKSKIQKLYGLGSIGTNVSSKCTSGSFPISSKETNMNKS